MTTLFDGSLAFTQIAGSSAASPQVATGGRLERRRDGARLVAAARADPRTPWPRCRARSRFAPADQLEVAVLAVVVLVGDDEQAFGDRRCPSTRSRARVLRSRRRHPPCRPRRPGSVPAVFRRRRTPTHVRPTRRRRGEAHLPSAPARECNALDLFRDAAARRDEVHDAAHRIRFRLDRQRHHAERFVAVIHRRARIVDDAVFDALAERYASHEPRRQRALGRKELPLQHLPAVRHAEGIDTPGNRALEAAQSRELVVGHDRTRPASG